MQRTTFVIDGRTHTGVQFTASKGVYFWIPDGDRLYHWHGYGWQAIAIDRLTQKRRRELTQAWGQYNTAA